MTQTESIKELATALAKAQGEIEGASKDTENPFFKSKYADLGSVIAAMRKPFADNGLAVHQGPRGTNGELRLVTRIIHKSGEWLEDDGFPLLMDKQNMQGLGSATTYARRYGLMSAAGIAPEDDDGNAAVKGAGKDGTKYETKNDLWGGPIAKTKFKAALMGFVSELTACGDGDQLLAFLNSEESQAIVNQCMADMPNWYFGGDDSNVLGLEERIEGRKKELMEDAA